MEKNKVFAIYIPIILLVCLILLNVFIASEAVFVGGFMAKDLGFTVLPMKTSYRVSIYDIRTDDLIVMRINGVLLSTGYIGESTNDVIAINAYGPDIFLVILSVVVLVLYIGLYKLVYRENVKIFFLSLVLLGLIIPTYLLYHNTYIQPSTDIGTFHTTRPLKIYEQQNIIVTDIVKHRALIHISSNKPFTLAYMELATNSSAKIIAFNTKNYTGILRVNTETAIIIVPFNCSVKNFNYVYRRIEFIKNYDSLVLMEYSFLPLIPILGDLIIISYYRKPRETSMDIRSESTPQQSEASVSDLAS